jgi:hypothetical protein
MRIRYLILAALLSQSVACGSKTKETADGSAKAESSASAADEDGDHGGGRKKKRSKRGPDRGHGDGTGSARSHGSAPPPTPTATATASATASATPAAPSQESFFSGDLPASVKLKPIKTWAIESGVLFFQPVEEWSGGKLPGNEYMAQSKDQSAVFRVSTHNGVTSEIRCKDIASVAALAPAKVTKLEEVSAPRVVAVGRNKFAAKEGECKGEGPKGATEVHFIDILREDPQGGWHYEVVVSFPKDAPQAAKDEAKAFARSLEFNGKNGYKLP